MEEIWKDIKGYENYYQVSNLGRVRSLDRYVATVGNPSGKRLIKGKIKKQTLRTCGRDTGYYYVVLSKNNIDKLCSVHRLVAEAFVPNPNDLPCINHRDEIKTNNHMDNLEWCTISYNNSYGTARERGGAKLSKSVLKFDLDGNLIKKYKSLTIAANEEGVSKGNIENICIHRKGKQTVNGFIFMYEEDYNKNGFIGYKNTRLRPVSQYDLNGKFIRRFDSIKQAAETIPNISKNGQSNITAACKHRQQFAYGYVWRYADEVEITDYVGYNK